MSNHLSVGTRGEKIAADWLEAHGFVVMERNWRSGKREIDIIATKANRLHFIEVKTRRSTAFGMPEVQVDPAKLRSIRIAAEAFLEQHPQWRRIQFDVVSIRLRGSDRSIDYFEDV